MSTAWMWVSIAIVWAIAFYAIAKALSGAATKIKQYDLEIEKARKEGSNGYERNSQDG